MLVPTIPGWKAETIGDDICWMKFGDDGRLYAINPEAGFFGVAPGTGWDTNANAMETLWGNCIYTNTALTDDGDVWWEGMTDTAPARATDWRGNAWNPEMDTPAAHPNARFTARRCSARRSSGVGGSCRRADLGDPLRWPSTHDRAARHRGEQTGSTACSSARSWRRRPLPPPRVPSATCASTRWRCCRSAATTTPTTSPTGWAMEKATDPANLPKIFFVNWFRRDDDGRFLWPGFGENSRVLKWVFERVERHRRRPSRRRSASCRRRMPSTPTASRSTMPTSTRCCRSTSNGWQSAIPQIREHYARFGDRLPAALNVEVDTLEAKLADA